MPAPHPYRRTLDLEEAAAFLKVSKETLRRKAARGEVRGAKPGKCWAFLEDDLVAYLQSLYPENQQNRLTKGLECSANEAKSGGLTLPHQTAKGLDGLLEQLKKRKHKSFTTASRPKHGDRFN